MVRTRRQRRLTQKSEADKLAIDKKMANYRATYEAYLKERGKMDLRSARRFAAEFRVSHGLLKHTPSTRILSCISFHTLLEKRIY